MSSGIPISDEQAKIGQEVVALGGLGCFRADIGHCATRSGPLDISTPQDERHGFSISCRLQRGTQLPHLPWSLLAILLYPWMIGPVANSTT